MSRPTFLVFHDAGPDRLGRRAFTWFRRDQGGIYRPEPSLFDGKPVGYRRAQGFFCDPQRFLDRGATVLASDEEADRMIAEAETRG